MTDVFFLPLHALMNLRAAGKMQQAINCYQGAISADPDDVDAIWDRAYLLRETGNHIKVGSRRCLVSVCVRSDPC